MIDAISIDELHAHRLFLTDLCSTETYRIIAEELLTQHPRDSSGELPEAYFDELSTCLKDLFTRCGAMCGK